MWVMRKEKSAQKTTDGPSKLQYQNEVGYYFCVIISMAGI